MYMREMVHSKAVLPAVKLEEEEEEVVVLLLLVVAAVAVVVVVVVEEEEVEGQAVMMVKEKWSATSDSEDRE